MLTMSPYLEFANSLIDKYRGFHEAYTQISLIHPERASENPEPVQTQQNYVTNLYRIQNIREENYLYTKNLTFLTELLVKKFQRNLYPSVEKQVEKMIREEFSDVRKDTVENFTKVIHQFVEKEGAEKISVLREKLLEKENNTEIKWQKEQEVLFRKLENIYQSSIYHSRHIQNADQRKFGQKHLLSNEQTLVFPTIREENKEERTQPVSQSEILEQWTGILNRSLTMQSTEIFNQEIQKQVRQNFRTENVTNIRNEGHQESVLNYHVDGEEYHQHQEVFPRQEISARKELSPRQEHTQSLELHHSETELKYLQEHAEGKDVKSEHAEGKHVKNEHAENQQVPEIWNVQKLESMRKAAEHPSENITNIRNEVHQESVLNYHVDGEEHHQHQEVFPRQEISSGQEHTQSRKSTQSPELHHSETELQYLQEHAEDKRVKSGHTEGKHVRNEHEENEHVKNEHAENQQVPEVWNVQKLESMHKDAEHLTEDILNIRNEVHQESVLNYHVDGEEHHQHQEVFPRQEISSGQEQTQSQKQTQSPELRHSETELMYLQEHAEDKHVKSEHTEGKHVKNEHAENQQVPEIWNVQKLESMRKAAEHPSENITNIRNEVHQESVLNYHVDGEEHHQHQELLPKREAFHKQEIRSAQDAVAEQEIWNVQKLESMHKDAEHLTEDITNIRNEVHQESVLNYYVDEDEYHQHQEVFPRQEISARKDLSPRQEHIQSPELHHLETELKYLQEHAEDKHVKSEHAEGKHVKTEHTEGKHVKNEHAENQQVPEVWNVQKLESMQKVAEHLTESITNIRNEVHQESILNYHVDGEEHHQHQEVFPRQEISSGQEQLQSQKRTQSPELHHSETELQYLQEHAEGKHAKSEYTEGKHVKNEHAENQQVPEIWNVQKLESMRKDAEYLAENITNIRNEVHQESVLNYHVAGEEHHQHQELSGHTTYETGIVNKMINETYRNNPQKFQHMPASMVYSEESGKSGKTGDPELSKLQKQVDEVVKDLRTIEEKTVVRKKEITAKQQEIVREVLKNDSEVWSFGNGRDAIQREVHRILEEQMPESINQIAGKVYRRLEKELKMERGRRGMN